jgi:ChaC-like protein
MLTPEDGALVHQVLEDPGSDPTWFYHADKDYVALVQGLLTSHSGEPDTWHFADGSLIWKPELDHAEVCKGAAQGWHGFFCFGIKRFWGTKDLPGLMMSPDRVGQCQGVLWRLQASGAERIKPDVSPLQQRREIACCMNQAMRIRETRFPTCGRIRISPRYLREHSPPAALGGAR